MFRSKYRTSPQPMATMPPGVPYIIGNEFAERFSFYGMKGILVVFMTQYLMTHSGELDLMSGPEATGYYHLFTSAVYFTPLLGAILADVFFGKYLTIIALSLVYCAGHAMLALDDTRLGLALGLGLIALGAGGIKPCVSAHVGDQFGELNKQLLPKVFGWFYIAINVGAFCSNLLTPWLLNHPDFGPQWAFGVPGGLMLLATWVFWLGRRKFAHIPPGGIEFVKEVFSGEGLRALGKLSIIYVVVAAFWALFDQTGSTWVIQARSMDRQIFGITLFEAQFQAANPFLILLLVPLFTFVIYPTVSRVWTMTPLRKIAVGMFVTVLAFAVPAVIEMNISGGRIVKVSDQAPRRTAIGDWSAWNLIDGPADGSGWATAKLAEETAPDDAEDAAAEASSSGAPAAEAPSGDPPASDGAASDEPAPDDSLGSVVIRLRERTPWTINAVEINPVVRGVMTDEDPTGEAAEAFVDRSRFARTVTIQSATSENGPWTDLVTANLTQEDALQRFDFDPVTTEFVRFRVDDNWGGPHAAIGRIRILSDLSAPPPAAAPAAAAAWPDVAAIGFKPHIWWQLLAYILITAAEVMISITCLEFSYTQAPRRMKSFIMGAFFLSVSLGNIIVTAVNFFIQNEDGTSKLEGASYYWFFTGLMLATAILFIPVAYFYKERAYIQQSDEGDVPPEKPVAEGVDER